MEIVGAVLIAIGDWFMYVVSMTCVELIVVALDIESNTREIAADRD